jgi:hypothetical protein
MMHLWVGGVLEAGTVHVWDEIVGRWDELWVIEGSVWARRH